MSRFVRCLEETQSPSKIWKEIHSENIQKSQCPEIKGDAGKRVRLRLPSEGALAGGLRLSEEDLRGHRSRAGTGARHCAQQMHQLCPWRVGQETALQDDAPGVTPPQ